MDGAMEDRDSATYSLESNPSQPAGMNRVSIDDIILPTVRRSAIQIVTQPISPRRQAKKPAPSNAGTLQITKLVLKTPPGSPKRQSKNPGILIKSIQTIAGPGLIGTGKQKPSALMDNTRNVPEPAESYRITPIVESGVKGSSSRKDFETRRAERERSAHEFQDFLRESFKENKTPSPTSPSPPIPAVVESSRVSAMINSESESKSVTQQNSIANRPPMMMNGAINIAIPSVDQPGADGIVAPVTSPPVAAARRSLLMATQASLNVGQMPATKQPERVSKEPTSTDNHESKTAPNESIKSLCASALVPPKQMQNKTGPKLPAKLSRPAVNEPVKKKEKSYDPARAREFIREQQAKRRLEKNETPSGTNSGGAKTVLEKDLIKQRLETLRQSSQKLVAKNVQKARTRSQSCVPEVDERACKDAPFTGDQNGPGEQHRSRPSTTKLGVSNLRKFPSTPTLKLNKPPVASGIKQKNPIKPPVSTSNGRTQPLSNELTEAVVHEKCQITSVQTPSESISASSDKLRSSIGSKIGILRKPDDLALEDIGSRSSLKPDPITLPPSIKMKNTQQTPSTMMVNAQLIVINADEDDDRKSIAEAEKELKLDVPNVSLVAPNKSGTQQHENGPAQEQQHPEQPIKSIPSWLKQSLRQPDPYPFIVAVRKKIEAVRGGRNEDHAGDVGKLSQIPEGKRNFQVQTSLQNAKSNAYLDAIESVPYIGKQNVANTAHNKPATMAQPMKHRPSGDILADGSAIMTNISSYASSNTTSEISSIKSDIAPPMPPLLCSTRVEVLHQTPVRSLSASVHGSGPISPLSMERISQMQIATPKVAGTSKPSIEEQAAVHNTMFNEIKTNVPPTRPITVVKNNRAPQATERSQKELEYQRLLESFNRSLTHVIEVNQQLYSALKNVPAPTVVPQEILRIRDEVTQTSQPVVVIPSKPAPEAMDRCELSQSDHITPLVGGSTTTASNYSDDFEHQSQTPDAVPRTPDPKLSPPIGNASAASSTPTESSATSSSSSASSSEVNGSTGKSGSSDNTTSDNSSPSSSEFSSSNEGTSLHDDDSAKVLQQVQNRLPNATVDGRKNGRASNATTANSSDIDSRSYSLSDSHNNTTNHTEYPPMPEEYLPSLEESLRRGKHSSASNDREEIRSSARLDRPPVEGGSSPISEHLVQTDDEKSFSLKHTEQTNDEMKVEGSFHLPTESDGSSSMDKSTLKEDEFGRKSDMNADTTANSDLLAAMFNRTDLEVSILSATVSETNVSYSSIGMFDQLINSERSREEQLVSRVHAKQKALLNRAKGQLAWLELQKQRLREKKGMAEQISAIKKKQRAILLRLEKDRAELNRAIKNGKDSAHTAMNMSVRTPITAKNVDSKLNSYCSSPTLAPVGSGNGGSLTLRKSPCRTMNRRQLSPHQLRNRKLDGSTVTTTTTTTTSNSVQIAIRGRELEPNDRLEDILLRREVELRKRKEHVQRLLEWHRKLEREEEELLAVEDKLLAYNSRKLEGAMPSGKEYDRSIEMRVQHIEKSLKTLQGIPTKTARNAGHSRIVVEGITGPREVVAEEEEDEDVVKTAGSKLNRLWYRLTGIKEQRYEPGRTYPITRTHLEALYEDAKRCVLEGFRRNDGQLEAALLERSIEVIGNLETEKTTTTTTTESDNVSLQAMNGDHEQTIRALEDVRSTENERPATPAKSHSLLVEMEKGDTTIEHSNASTEQRESNEAPQTAVELAFRNDNDDDDGEEEGRFMLLSSTVVTAGWSPENRRSIESVEFHTLEETGSRYQTLLPDGSVEEEEPCKSESYTMTFEEHPSAAVVHDDDDSNAIGTDSPVLPAGADESQPLIEDMSLPPNLLNNTSVLLNDEAEGETGEGSSSCESSITVELSMPLIEGGREVVGQEENDSKDTTTGLLEFVGSEGSDSIVPSLEEASGSSVSTEEATTPTTITPTSMPSEVVDDEIGLLGDRRRTDDPIASLGQAVGDAETPIGSSLLDDEVEEDEDIFQLRSSHVSSRTGSPSSCASELEKRLATLHDELEELSETFERTPLMKSPTMPKAKTAAQKEVDEERTTSSEATISFDEPEVSSIRSGCSEQREPDEKDAMGNGASVIVVANVSSSVTSLERPIASKMEVKLRPKAAPSASVCGEGGITIASGGSTSGNNNRAAASNHLAEGGMSVVLGGSSPPPLSPPAVVRMPDIINEAEVLRRQQLQIEQEIKELEQQVGFFREIPNKPPPPYIPPANGSPLALLFPSESRIDELIDQRVEELHRDRVPPERLRSDHVTNVYEKLILDMCKELYRDLRPADPTVSFRTIAHDKRPLVFYNPPDPLRCMKDFLRAKIRRVLNEEQLALQQHHQHQHHQQHQQLLLHHHQLQQQQQQQQQSHQGHHPHASSLTQHHQQQQLQLHQHQHLLHHCATMPFLFTNGGGWCASRRKRDQVDEILAQEMHDDDARWTNFDREELEVKDRITDELLKSLLTEALHDMAEAYRCKARAGNVAAAKEEADDVPPKQRHQESAM